MYQNSVKTKHFYNHLPGVQKYEIHVLQECVQYLNKYRRSENETLLQKCHH